MNNNREKIINKQVLIYGDTSNKITTKTIYELYDLFNEIFIKTIENNLNFSSNSTSILSNLVFKDMCGFLNPGTGFCPNILKLETNHVLIKPYNK